MKRIGQICFPLILLWSVSLGAQEPSTTVEHIFSMPLSEAHEVITGWLKKNGFEVLQLSADNRRVQLQVSRDKVNRVLRLYAHSALATRVEAQFGDDENGQPPKDLWAYLSDYLKKPQSRFAEQKTIIPAAVRNCQRAVVCIYADLSGKPLQLSGFAIDHAGLIATTAHDLQLGQAVSVQFHDERQMNGRVVKLDAYRDLSLIQVPEALETVISLKKGRYLPKQDDTLFASGCPRSDTNGVQTGFLDGLPRRVEGLPLWRVRMHIEPGSSGSPVFDNLGRIAAVVKGRHRGTHDTAFLIPFETLLNFMEKY